MPRDNREDILLDYAFISLISSKIKVVIIGGGRAGYIKAKSFLKRGYRVYVVSNDFYEEISALDGQVHLIKDSYDKKYILDKHLVVIATDDKNLNRDIRDDCEKYVKIYLYAEDFRRGEFINPIEIDMNNIRLGLHTTVGSPKTSLFLSEKVKECIDEYDDFVEYIGKLRTHIIDNTRDRNLNLEVMNFVNTDDFYFFYRKNKHHLIVKLFWGDDFDI